MRDEATPLPGRGVSAVILAYNRADALGTVLDRLEDLPIDEVLVVDNASEDGTAEIARGRSGKVRLIEAGRNLGIAGRNLGAQEARNDLLVMLDDDSYPHPGAIEKLVEAFRAQPRLGVAGGLVSDVDRRGRKIPDNEFGSFDWFLRGGRKGAPPAAGFEAFFFPEGACMARREAFLEAGGYFEPFFFQTVEIDLATRLLALDWDVRYIPAARFEHMKEPAGRMGIRRAIRFRVRNQIWYFWLRFPAAMAAWRIPAYLVSDFVECTYYGALGSWFGGIADAWRERDRVRAQRHPLPPDVLHRAELNRGQVHVRFWLGQIRRRLRAPRVRRPRRLA